MPNQEKRYTDVQNWRDHFPHQLVNGVTLCGQQLPRREEDEPHLLPHGVRRVRIRVSPRCAFDFCGEQ